MPLVFIRNQSQILISKSSEMKTKIYYILFLFIMVAMNTSCTKDFEEINTPIDLYTTASDGSLFLGIQHSLIRPSNELFYVNNEVLYKQTQMGALTKEAWGNYNIGTEDIWSNYYTRMPNVRELERRFDAAIPSPELNNMKAMVKILLAYKTFKVTDLFGDIPFFEAGYGYLDDSKLYPKFDTQRDIYLFLLDELEWCDDNINLTATSAEPFATFKTYDILFSGDMEMWLKFANSLRLRYAVRMYDKEPVIAAAHVQEIIEDNKKVFIGMDLGGAALESASLCNQIQHLGQGSTEWAFREHKNLRMGTTMWHQMSENDSTDGSGIFDRRAYFFFDTNNDGEWTPYPQDPPAGFAPDGGAPYGSQRRSDAAYFIKGDDCLYSPFNFFLISDNQIIPEILISGAEVHFLKAEAYQRGIGVAQSDGIADNEFLSGLQASYYFWDDRMSQAQLPNGTGTFYDVVTVPSSLDLTKLQMKVDLWNFSTQEEKIQMIYTQRMIDLFWQPAEAFALARTGRTPREGDPISFFRFLIPASEVNYNYENWLDAYGAADLTSTKIWWLE
ncbi:MAG: hypothetical protein A2W94_00580 [Bacteroidetes bacterium GWE2_42_42]|nr:MAG: hypothetical protein A2W94_00580 [Bacteroidetes bacterium GWE2_42_42]